jgi:hypothetical protein
MEAKPEEAREHRASCFTRGCFFVCCATFFFFYNNVDGDIMFFCKIYIIANKIRVN